VKRLIPFLICLTLAAGVSFANSTDSLLARFVNSTNQTEKIDILCEISNNYSQLDFFLSRDYALRAYKLSSELHDQNGQAKAAMSLGYAYDYHAQYDSAVYYYLESLRIYEFLNDTLGQSSALNNLGVCYFFSNQLDDALVYYKKSLQFEILTQNQNGIADSYNNMAVVFRHNGQIDSAEFYFLEARRIYTQLENFYGIAGTYLNAGQIALNRNNYRLAIEETKKAEKYFSQNENWSDAGSAFNAIATFFLKMDQLDSARFYALEGYNLNKSKGFNQFLLNSLDVLIEIDTIQKDYKMAVLHLIERAEIENYLHQNFKDEQIENSRNLYELGSKEKEIFSLQTDNSVKDETITKKGKQLSQLVLLIGVFAVMLLIIVFALLKLRKVNLKLAENNLTIQHNLEEKEWLLKEIHHRVKNNLQIVSSLLTLQTRYIKDESAISAIHDSQERVQAISILHQEIYRSDVLKSIPAKDYFDKLIKGIQSTFDPVQTIQLKAVVDPKLLDVDQLLPLGLMLNEMLTNAYKYGTTHVNPTIEISFSCSELDFELIVKDNGIKEVDLKNLEKSETLGMKLIQIFAKKMKANVSMENNHGFSVSVRGNFKSSPKN
jgi:two-component sensor histidine kinase